MGKQRRWYVTSRSGISSPDELLSIARRDANQARTGRGRGRGQGQGHEAETETEANSYKAEA